MIKRNALLFCLLHLCSITFAERMNFEGLLLCRLQNLPHRGLGMLFWAYVLQPDRADYARDYFIQYFIYTDGEMLLEGSRKPIVPMMAVLKAREFPNNKELQMIREIVMRNHFSRLNKQQEEEKK